MIRVGITGNIGSGKSYVCDFFKRLGIPVFDSDYEAKLLYDDPIIKRRIIDRFGEDSYQADGRLNRARMAERVFSDACALGFVEATLYPELNRRFGIWAESQASHYVLYESALIYEKHLEAMFDAVIVVAASEPVRIRRVMFRDRCSEEQVLSRMTKQWPQSEKVMKADYVVMHEVDDEDDFLWTQVNRIHSDLTQRGEVSR